MIEHVTFLKCDAPGCLAQFSSAGLLANADRYVFDAALRHGWTAEQALPTSALKILCPAHSEKVRESQTLPAEKAVRLLINNPPAIRSAPPFLVCKLKLLLADFNAKTFTWRNT
jgi:hypothetical protein